MQNSNFDGYDVQSNVTACSDQRPESDLMRYTSGYNCSVPNIRLYCYSLLQGRVSVMCMHWMGSQKSELKPTTKCNSKVVVTDVLFWQAEHEDQFACVSDQTKWGL
jgi:hypothetical protein